MFKLPWRHQQVVWLFRVALVINLVAISWLAFTGSQVSVAAVYSDKANHFVAFFVLAYCLDMSLPQRRFLISKLALLLGYGVLIELVQSQLAFRSASLLDVLADAVGIFTYWVLRQKMRRLIKPRASSVKQYG